MEFATLPQMLAPALAWGLIGLAASCAVLSSAFALMCWMLTRPEAVRRLELNLANLASAQNALAGSQATVRAEVTADLDSAASLRDEAAHSMRRAAGHANRIEAVERRANGDDQVDAPVGRGFGE